MDMLSGMPTEAITPRSSGDKRKLNWGVLPGTIAVIGRRILFGLIILLVVILFTHFGLDMARGQEFSSAVSRSGPKTLETVLGILSGDLGLSEAASSSLNPIPVSEVYRDMLLKSFGLLMAALLFAVAIAVPLGIFSARRRSALWSTGILIISIIGISMPSFLAAFLLQRFVIQLTQATGQRFLSVGGFGWDAHIILPALVLAARPIAQIIRVTSGTVSDIQDQDYVRTAKGKGLTERWVLNRHILRNAAIPIITTIAISLRFALISLPVVEAYFGWPGLGYYLLRSIPMQDDNLTVILVLCLGALFIIVNVILDVAYRVLDPRIRSQSDAVGASDQLGVIGTVKVFFADAAHWIRHNPIKRRITKLRAPKEPSPFSAILEGRNSSIDQTAAGGTRQRSVLRSVSTNFPLIVGAILLLIVILIALFGHLLAPHNPYATQGLKIEDGEFLVPPFEPGELYPWGTDVIGRDMSSLVLSGAWQTLRLAGLAVIARVVVGFLLGSVGGWYSGKTIDRLVMAVAEIISAFPALLLAMILILALGIREGMLPFVIALCFVGWGELMQYVRGEVITMRSNTYVESAVSIGQRTYGIIKTHVVPNLTPAMISIIALEMGAVLMLLGELGFIGVFIGGGAFMELDIGGAPYHYSDVPEWGALLSNVRLYAISYPWAALYPAMAFFVAIMAFNFFGEGVRKLVIEEGVILKRFVNRYTLALGVLLVVAASWWRGSTGSLSIYQKQASEFIGMNAFAHAESLSSPITEGRAIGTIGMDVAADWIAQEFSELGLQPGGKSHTFFQEKRRDFQSLDAVPMFVIDDNGAQPVYQQDFVEYPAYFRNMGTTLGPVRFIALGELSISRVNYRSFPVLEDKDYTGEVLMVFSGQEAALLQGVSRGGILVVSEDPQDLRRNYTLSARSPIYESYGSGRQHGQDSPVLWISEEIADRLLKGTGLSVQDLREKKEDLNKDELFELETENIVAMDVQGTVHEKQIVRQVIGHWPGVAGTRGHQLDDKLIVVLAKYDSPPLRPDGEFLPAVNDNASGLAVMLETIRVMKETNYQPNKTFLFVAYTGEGTEGGVAIGSPEIARLLDAKTGFATYFDIEAIIELRGLGSGDGDGLLLETGGSLRLAELFEESAQRMGVKTKRSGDDVDISTIYHTGSARDSAEEAPSIGITWEGWEYYSWTNDDTLERLSASKLEDAGRTIALALMTIGREVQY
ncbi:MAG: ABC transporter permease subunit [Anaerolineales bacterium]